MSTRLATAILLAAGAAAWDDEGAWDGGPDARAWPAGARVFVAGSGDESLHVFDLETLE